MALIDVIGQEKAVNILLRTLQRDRIPSSYLFTGESGIGKKFTAVNLAKALNCLKHVTSNELQVTSKTQIQNSELNSSLVTRHLYLTVVMNVLLARRLMLEFTLTLYLLNLKVDRSG